MKLSCGPLRRICLALTLLATAVPAPTRSQEVRPDSLALPVVYLDCTGMGCDFDHFRRTIPFVLWARERQGADVHILVTTEPAGGGAQRFTIHFVGSGPFEGVDTRTRYTSARDDTFQQVRDGLGRTLSLALGGLVAGTPVAEDIQLVYMPGRVMPRGPAGEVDDPWKQWVFRIGVNGAANGERLARSFSGSGNIFITRTTDAWRIDLRAIGNYDESEFDLDSTTTVTSISRSYRGSGLIVRSLGGHFAIGARSLVTSSTFLNQRFMARFAPAVEFNVFRYDQSTDRQFRFLYEVGAMRVEYDEETIYQVTEETLYDQTLSLILELIQPWGRVNLELSGSAYLHDIEQHRVGLASTIDWNLFRGVSLFLTGDVSRIANQRSLPSGGATDIEILLRRRERATSFRYFGSVGLSFTFGSRYSNVVNTRLGR